MELACTNPRSVPAWLAFRRPILPTSPFLDRVGGSWFEGLFSPAIGKHLATSVYCSRSGCS
jgi:hypothetical protein